MEEGEEAGEGEGGAWYGCKSQSYDLMRKFCRRGITFGILQEEKGKAERAEQLKEAIGFKSAEA